MKFEWSKAAIGAATEAFIQEYTVNEGIAKALIAAYDVDLKEYHEDMLEELEEKWIQGFKKGLEKAAELDPSHKEEFMKIFEDLKKSV